MARSDARFTIEDFIEAIEWVTSEWDDFAWTKSQFSHIAMEALECLGIFDCFGCGRNCMDLDERFMVHNALWNAHGVEGMLCVGCFEKRLGRRLTPKDFTECDGNNFDGDEKGWLKSPRLLNRMGRKAA
jgi:hypothetical protein